MTGQVWITYAWADNDEGDFDYLVQELVKAGIPAIYDKIALIPGRRLWQQIADRIGSGSLSAWAYLITPTSLQSANCQEEMSYALQHALEAKGAEFPLIGLLHNVSIRDVPVALRVRLCVNLANPDWIEEVRAGAFGMPPRQNVESKTPFTWNVHSNYCGKEDHTAIEVRPRFGEINYWRLAFPSDGPQPIDWGIGPANGGGIGGVTLSALEGQYSDLGGMPMKYVGAGSPISASTSAYAVFKGELPEKMFFGAAKEAFGTEVEGFIIDVHE